MSLHVNGDELAIAQMGSDFLLLEKPYSHPPTTAEVSLIVDGHEERWSVNLPEGIRPGENRVIASRI